MSRVQMIGLGVFALALFGLIGGVAAASSSSGGETHQISQVDSSVLKGEDIPPVLRLVADWQLDHPARYPPQHWGMVALYDGLLDTSIATRDPKYLAAVLKTGESIGFAPGRHIYSADAVGAGYSWLRIYLMNPDRPEILQPFIDRYNQILANPVNEKISLAEEPQTPGVGKADRWTYVDALFMAPPTITLLSLATGDYKYMAFADREFRYAYDSLYDKNAHLFWRDARYIGERSSNGRKEFWGRGNGWVYAGLAKILTTLPKDYENRQFYVDLYKEMSKALLDAQQPDGLWYPSLLDPGEVPIGETSASALITFGMARGIRLGLLDQQQYRHAVERGWLGLLTRIKPSGEVNYTQPIGAKPEPFPPDTTRPWGTGPLLSAGAEVYGVLEGAEILGLLHGKTDPTLASLRAEASRMVDQAPKLSVEQKQTAVLPAPEPGRQRKQARLKRHE